MLQDSRQKVIVLGCLLVIVLCVGSSGILIYTWSNMRPNGPGGISRLFVDSLMTNDRETALSLVSTDKREEIDQWISTHQPYRCNNFAYDTGAASGGVLLNDDTWRYHVQFLCYDPVNPYCISVTDIYMTQVDDKWQITDWLVDCEINDYCDMCIGN